MKIAFAILMGFLLALPFGCAQNPAGASPVAALGTTPVPFSTPNPQFSGPYPVPDSELTKNIHW